MEKRGQTELVNNSLKLIAGKIDKRRQLFRLLAELKPYANNHKIFLLRHKCAHNFGKWVAVKDLSSGGSEFHWVASRKEKEWVPRSVRALGGMSRCSPLVFLMTRPVVMRAIASMLVSPKKSGHCT